MCLFPLPNNNINSIAYKKGVREFACGACPECLSKRSSSWALRAVYEAKTHVNNCMVTLTYDNFLRDVSGHIVRDSRGNCVEMPVNPDLKVNQRDVQLFIKRLRKWYSLISTKKIKYIACAEYGSRTHRAHYHCILFGVKFPDIHFYKKSKRGNPIYMSQILTNLWGHGICTVDSIDVHSAVARYCTKYCAKSRSDNTFMLASQKIGLSSLLRDFNGISYFIDGREYPIPRVVWQEYITNKYHQYSENFSYKYVNFTDDYKNGVSYDRSAYDIAALKRKVYFAVRDCDPVYSNYINYWKSRSAVFDKLRAPVIDRITLLPDSKYHFYKAAALRCYTKRKRFIPFPAPNSNCVSAYERYKFALVPVSAPRFFTCRYPSRPNTASDTKKVQFCPFDGEAFCNFDDFEIIFPFKLLTLYGHQCIIDLDD